jgi:predicted enzyme related to lactoylglutathione lyase
MSAHRPRDPHKAIAVRRVVPNVFDADPGATRDFYAGLLDLEVGMDLGWVSTLVAPGNRTAQITVATRDAEPGRDPFASVEVDDVDAVHDRAVRADHEIVYALRDEPWGVRRFMVRDPAGRVLNVLSHRPTG